MRCDNQRVFLSLTWLHKKCNSNIHFCCQSANLEWMSNNLLRRYFIQTLESGKDRKIGGRASNWVESSTLLRPLPWERRRGARFVLSLALSLSLLLEGKSFLALLPTCQVQLSQLDPQGQWRRDGNARFCKGQVNLCDESVPSWSDQPTQMISQWSVCERSRQQAQFNLRVPANFLYLWRQTFIDFSFSSAPTSSAPCVSPKLYWVPF